MIAGAKRAANWRLYCQVVLVSTSVLSVAAAAGPPTSQPAGGVPTSRPHVNKPATPRKQPEESWAKKHAAFIERAKKGDVDVLFTGDSITAGWNGAGITVWRKHFGDMKAANWHVGSSPLAFYLAARVR
jgi:hypothetical protein